MHQKDWYTSTHGGSAKEKNLSRLPKPVDHLSAGDWNVLFDAIICIDLEIEVLNAPREC
jgi:hypothetical protein